MIGFSYADVAAGLRHIQGGVPIERLTHRLHQGEHRSIFRGSGPDLFGIRPYDALVDATSQIISHESTFDEDEVYVREAIELREVRIVLLCRLSSALNFRFKKKMAAKQRMLLETAGFVSLTGARDRDPVGLIGFSDDIVVEEPMMRGRDHAFHLVKQMYQFFETYDVRDRFHREHHRANFQKAFNRVEAIYDRPCCIICISDVARVDELIPMPQLRRLASFHEMIFLLLDDEHEFDVRGKFGYVRMSDMETGRTVVVPVSKFRRIREDIAQSRERFIRRLRSIGVAATPLTYGQHFSQLHTFFVNRREQLR